MPQMKPMSWLLSSFFLTMVLFIFISNINFKIKILTPSTKKYIFKNKSMTW